MPDSIAEIRKLLKEFGVRLIKGTDAWTLKTAQAAYWAVFDVASRYKGVSSDENLGERFQSLFNTSNNDPLLLIKVSEYKYLGTTYYAGGVTRGGHTIELANINYSSFQRMIGTLCMNWVMLIIM